MSKTVVIHHSADFDGIFCREIAKKFLPDATLIGWDYGDPVPDPTVISSDDQLYMLDISVESLMGHPRLQWVDHHKSAIQKWPNVRGYQIDGVAACRLAWQFFTHPEGTPDPLPEKEDYIERRVSEPLAVRLAGEYDIWDKRDPNAELFQYGLRSCDISGYWPNLLRDDEETVASLLDRGEAVQYAKAQENEGIIKSYGFDVDFEGLHFLACNHARFNSLLFTAGIKPEHDALLGFNWSGKEWRVSLYHAPGKEHHDLSAIAVKYGGGGHRGACGFRMKSVPFLT
jgi:hypothetical protein